MAGIYGLLGPDHNLPIKNYSRFYTGSSQHLVHEEHRSDDFIYGRCVLDKFQNDRFLHRGDRLVICIEGVLYHSDKNNAKHVVQKYKSEGINSISSLAGFFCGFIYDLDLQKLFVFTDHVSSKALYYHYNQHARLFAFSSKGHVLASILKDTNQSLQIDHDAFKAFLSFGYMLDDQTPVSEIKKLAYGSILEIDLNSFEMKIDRHFELKRSVTHTPHSEVLHGIDDHMIRAVKQEWSKDLEYNYPHLALLSGGMDSRVNVMLAHEYGFTDVDTMTFSERNTTDRSIADQVAAYLNTNHTFVHIDGSFLGHSIIDYVKASDGLIVFFGSAHGYSSLQTLHPERFGRLHTGQIGDLVFGSYSGHPPFSMSDIGRLAFRNDAKIIQSIDMLPEMLAKYEYEGGAEICSYEQRVFNCAMTGDHMNSHVIDFASPFYDKQLIDYCLNIPDEFKKNQSIYLDWFNTKHPEIAKFTWQKSGFKPKNKFLTRYGTLRKKALARVYRKIGWEYDNMNPFNVWFKKKPELASYMTSLFMKHIDVIDDRELKEMATTTFDKGDAISMMTSLSAILSTALYLNKLEE